MSWKKPIPQSTGSSASIKSRTWKTVESSVVWTELVLIQSLGLYLATNEMRYYCSILAHDIISIFWQKLLQVVIDCPLNLAACCMWLGCSGRWWLHEVQQH